MFSRNLPQPPEDGLPPEEVRFEEISAEPWPDGRRVRVKMQMTPFLQRPNIHVVITNPHQTEVASVDIIENMDVAATFTIHLRGEFIGGKFTLTASLVYPELGTVSQKSVDFEISEQSEKS